MVETGVTGAAAQQAGAAGAKRGRRTDGGQAKEAIEQAARQLFAEHGFDPTSVRQVALAAGVDDPEYRAMLVITQLMGLVMARYIVKMEPLASRPVPDLVAALAGTFQRYLTGPLDR